MRACLFAATFALAFASAAWAQPSGPAVTVKTLTETDGVHPGVAARAAVLVTIADGWHVNAHEPLDEFLVPTSLRLTEPADLTAVEVVYPEPDELAFSWSDEVILVYGGTFVIGVAVAIPESFQPGGWPGGARSSLLSRSRFRAVHRFSMEPSILGMSLNK